MLIVTAAAALATVGVWLWRRWQATLAAQREQEQLSAMNEVFLARQKQRFQRALVVDSVNLELPAIKEMDVTPTVPVDKILSRQQQQAVPAPQSSAPSSSSMPTLGSEGRRQWQQFMANSRATEVKDVFGSRTNRSGSPRGQAEAQPHGGMDDRKLADLSERIRRANEERPGGSAATAPVITFEQLYADSKESDEAAMARRAAERKARWQQQQEGKSGAARAAVAPYSCTSGKLGPPMPSGLSGSGATSTARVAEVTTATTGRGVAPGNPFAAGPAAATRVAASRRDPYADHAVSSGVASTASAMVGPPQPAVGEAEAQPIGHPAALRQDLQDVVVPAPASVVVNRSVTEPLGGHEQGNTRTRRAAPAGPLRKPEMAAAGLARLMRRPTAAANSDTTSAR